MKKNKHIGSSFESFLKEENILEEVNAAAIVAILGKKINMNLVDISKSNPKTRKSSKNK